MRTTRHQHTHGFSLIELLVSVGLFTVVMVVSVGTLLALVDANQKAQSLKSVMNNLNFALDSMTRTLRTGREFYCTNNTIPLDPPDNVEDCPDGGLAVVVSSDQEERVTYRFDESQNALVRKVGSGRWIRLTAPEVVIEEARFYVTGPASAAYPEVGSPDNVQPMVTISIRGTAGSQANTRSDFDIQTTVTQRLLDE